MNFSSEAAVFDTSAHRKGVEAAVGAAEAHRQPVVPAQPVAPVGKQADDVLGDVQDAAGRERHGEDEENHGAEPDEGPRCAGESRSSRSDRARLR